MNPDRPGSAGDPVDPVAEVRGLLAWNLVEIAIFKALSEGGKIDEVDAHNLSYSTTTDIIEQLRELGIQI